MGSDAICNLPMAVNYCLWVMSLKDAAAHLPPRLGERSVR